MLRQIITFRIGEQALGIDVMAVREIRAWSSAALMPHAPDYVLGMVNRRGSVLPIVDLSARLGCETTVPGEHHVIIVVQLGSGLQGFIVDAVSDIVRLAHHALSPAPSLGDGGTHVVLEGVVEAEDRLIMVLAISQLENGPTAAELIAA